MRDASPLFERARRNSGWLYVLNEDLQCIARPSRLAEESQELEKLVDIAVATWGQDASHGEMLIMVTPTISARVFPMHGPGGSCTIVYLEPLVVRVEK